MELSTVIFDIGGVVLNWVPERAFEQVMPADEVPGFMKRIGFDGWNRANDALASIEGSEDELVARFPADAARIRGYRQHFLRTVTEMVPGTPAVIAELGQAGVRLGALTNWAADMFALARPRFGVLTRFGDIVVSGTEGVVKPDPEIYRLACERLGIHPGEAVFIDDSPANVHAADEFGLHGLHFTSAAQLREDLVGLGLLADRAPVAEPLFHWTLRSRWAEATASGGFPWSTRDTDYNAEGFVPLLVRRPGGRDSPPVLRRRTEREAGAAQARSRPRPADRPSRTATRTCSRRSRSTASPRSSVPDPTPPSPRLPAVRQASAVRADEEGLQRGAEPARVVHPAQLAGRVHAE